MSLIKSVEHLARGAVGTALGAARHPIGTTAQVVGFAKGVASSGIGLVRGNGVPEQRASAAEAEATTVPEAAAPRPEPDIPGPDIVLKAVPTADELPEPVVIYADDDPAPETGEAFQTEPKPTTRADSTGGAAGDRFEAEDEADEALEDLEDLDGPAT
jgi:hypothetical protein